MSKFYWFWLARTLMFLATMLVDKSKSSSYIFMHDRLSDDFKKLIETGEFLNEGKEDEPTVENYQRMGKLYEVRDR